jgi:hypothetical protein
MQLAGAGLAASSAVKAPEPERAADFALVDEMIE